MRPALSAFVLALLVAMQATPVRAFSDAALIDGFNRTVFGSEYPSWGWQSRVVKKFEQPVRFYIDDRSAAGRSDEIASFLRSLPGAIRGLQASVVSDPARANFHIFVLDRGDYQRVVTREIYGRATSSFAPGKCLVRVLSGSAGITRADAVIVADEGEFLFRRCMVEEILQGLGPVNDDRSLPESVFNDESRHSTFSAFDRSLLNMLYHPAIRAGMTRREASRLLPSVLADLRAGRHGG
jgi:hypothetical protein